MPSAIMKPIAPSIRIPIAETFETVLNSRAEGFFSTCQTLLLCKMNDFSLDANAMFILD
jgi:hypothetical protein